MEKKTEKDLPRNLTMESTLPPSHEGEYRRKAQARPRRENKKKKAKGKRKLAATKEPSLDDVPLESFRIIQDEEGIATDYLTAVYDLIMECRQLRSYVQNLWQDVAYRDLNSAVAAAVSNVAIAMVKQVELSIFVDFPGHDSYETVMNTITRGDPEKAQGMFFTTLAIDGSKSGIEQPIYTTDVDVKEQFMINTYRDLLDFVTDYQQTRSGKPTKRMLAEIRDWDPDFDLSKATREQRLKWRRSYTINWLYDLVNVFSSIVVQRNILNGEGHAYERIDWSPRGPWHVYRRLFGLNEFAGVITSLAMQKPGTDVRKKILPHHVFQLRCIVDSLMVSRGWFQDSLLGEVFSRPAEGFRPRRDVDLFLDRKLERGRRGFLMAIERLIQLVDRAAEQGIDRLGDEDFSTTLKMLKLDFICWLGESKLMSGLTGIPPSRFSNTNSNGLWEYSPFLCGAGLVEGLQISYLVGMAVWDRRPEPTLLVHLYNMLIHRGYINKPAGFFGPIPGKLFQSDFFKGGQVPTSNFAEALLARIDETLTRRSVLQREAATRLAARTAVDIHGTFDPKLNFFFKTKSQLVIYGQADWDPNRILVEDLPLPSTLCFLRIGQSKKIVDPATGRTQFEETDLIRHARSMGLDDIALHDILRLSTTLDQDLVRTDEVVFAKKHMGAVQNAAPLGHKASMGFSAILKSKKWEHLTATDFLSLVESDIHEDVCGEWALSAGNYVYMTCFYYMLFERIEAELRQRRNSLYVRAFETMPDMGTGRRWNLAMLALAEEDDECLSVMAQMMLKYRMGMLPIYWGKLSQPRMDEGRDRGVAS